MPTIAVIHAVKIDTNHILSASGNAPDSSGPMFIPKNENTIVGIAIKIVSEVSTFITWLRLFEITDENASIVFARIVDEIEHISIAC